jgi:hypothetical protein
LQAHVDMLLGSRATDNCCNRTCSGMTAAPHGVGLAILLGLSWANAYWADRQLAVRKSKAALTVTSSAPPKIP